MMPQVFEPPYWKGVHVTASIAAPRPSVPMREGIEAGIGRCYGRGMNRQTRFPINDQTRKALEEIGGEPLAGSGFERETPEPEFSEKARPVETKSST